MTAQSILIADRKGTEPKKGKLVLHKLILLFAILGFCVVLFLGGAYTYYVTKGLIFPGVSIDVLPVGGMNLHQAIEAIDLEWNQDVTITAVDSSDLTRTWQVSPVDFGLYIDPQETAQMALSVGRGDGIVTGVRELIRIWMDGYVLPPIVKLDLDKALSAMQTWEGRTDVPVIEGELSVDGGNLEATTGESGKTLDILSSLMSIALNPDAARFKHGLIPFEMVTIEPAIKDVSAAAEEIDALLSASFSLQIYDPVTDETIIWTPSPEDIGPWLILQKLEDEYQVELNSEALRAYLVVQSETLGPERSLDLDAAYEAVRRSLRSEDSDILLVEYQPRAYTVQSGEDVIAIGRKMGIPYWMILDANPGLSLSYPPVGRTITIPPRDAMLPLPVVIGKRIVISITEQHMWIYQDGESVGDFVVSTGLAGAPTMVGVFQVLEHDINAYASLWDLHMPHFLSIYQATRSLMNGIHGLPTLSDGRRVWSDVLGQPASFGCIIMDLDAAETVYNWAEDGVVVEILP